MKKKILSLYYNLLWYIARLYIKKHKPYIVGINGSVGKTSCRMIVHQTLERHFPNLRISTSSKNFNWELGLSLSVFEINNWIPSPCMFIIVFFTVIWKYFFGKKKYDIIVLEYWIDRPKEMDFLLSIAKPDIWIFTAIDSVHSEQFGDPTAIAKEEIKMIKNTKEIAFLNINDTYAMQLKKHIEIDTITYQTEGQDKESDIYFDNISFVKKNNIPYSKFELYIKNISHTISTNIFGKANYGYIWVALSLTEIIKYKINQWFFSWIKYSKKQNIEQKFSLKYDLQPWRFSVFSWNTQYYNFWLNI
jgi:UDP-N-acetylmuramoyl-tripeptide--D-alanyl-D-alanine ligase